MRNQKMVVVTIKAKARKPKLTKEKIYIYKRQFKNYLYQNSDLVSFPARKFQRNVYQCHNSPLLVGNCLTINPSRDNTGVFHRRRNKLRNKWIEVNVIQARLTLLASLQFLFNREWKVIVWNSGGTGREWSFVHLLHQKWPDCSRPYVIQVRVIVIF